MVSLAIVPTTRRHSYNAGSCGLVRFFLPFSKKRPLRRVLRGPHSDKNIDLNAFVIPKRGPFNGAARDLGGLQLSWVQNHENRKDGGTHELPAPRACATNLSQNCQGMWAYCSGVLPVPGKICLHPSAQKKAILNPRESTSGDALWGLDPMRNVDWTYI
jgi:hypothetical protein